MSEETKANQENNDQEQSDSRQRIVDFGAAVSHSPRGTPDSARNSEKYQV